MRFDIGVYQDGSGTHFPLSHKVIKDLYSIVKAGKFITVIIINIDLNCKQIALTMHGRLDEKTVDTP